MVANILPAVIPDPRDGVNRLRFNLSEYQIKENHKCSNMVANILPAYPLPQNPRDGTIGRNSTFSEHGHVAIKLNGITKCSNMVATILPGPMPLTRPMGQKSTFSEHCHVAYQIKGNHERNNIVTHILLADTPPLKVNLGVGEMGFMFCDL